MSYTGCNHIYRIDMAAAAEVLLAYYEGRAVPQFLESH